MSSACPSRARRLLLLAAAACALSACQREERSYGQSPPEPESQEKIALSSLSPGPDAPDTAVTGKGAQYSANAYHISQGKQLFKAMNCTGCHGNGGGGSGPPLMDNVWIYGGRLENIVATIREGRPNGMPSFRGRIPEDQIWEIAAYVQSLSGNAPSSAAAPGRSDTLYPHESESRMPNQPPQQGGYTPPASEQQQ